MSELDIYLALKAKVKHKTYMYNEHKKDIESGNSTLIPQLLAKKLRGVTASIDALENCAYYKAVLREINSLLVKRDSLQGSEKQRVSLQITKLRKALNN